MMKKIFLLLMLCFLGSGICFARQRLHTEKEYQTYWCNNHNGQMEYILNDKARVDCLTDTLAVEVDFANKWHECAGQALFYGEKTKRQPTCVLIMENPEKDLKYLKRLRTFSYKKGIRTFTIKPDVLNNSYYTNK